MEQQELEIIEKARSIPNLICESHIDRIVRANARVISSKQFIEEYERQETTTDDEAAVRRGIQTKDYIAERCILYTLLDLLQAEVRKLMRWPARFEKWDEELREISHTINREKESITVEATTTPHL